jgi:hypothetical protein
MKICWLHSYFCKPSNRIQILCIPRKKLIMKPLLLFVATFALSGTSLMAQDSPAECQCLENAMPNAHDAGSCSESYLTEQVLVRAGYERLTAVPAELEAGVEQLEVKPAGRRFVTEPARYEEVEDRVMVKSPGKNNSVYETVTEIFWSSRKKSGLLWYPLRTRIPLFLMWWRRHTPDWKCCNQPTNRSPSRVEVKPAGVQVGKETRGCHLPWRRSR